MMDYHEDYPKMTTQECRDYVMNEIFDMKSDGSGCTKYRKGICDDLKFLGNVYIYKVIDTYAKMNGIIIKNKIETVEVTKEMLDKLHTDSDIEDLAIELNVSVRELNYVISNKQAEGTHCYNCKHVAMGCMYPCSVCSRKHQIDYYESVLEKE